MTYFFRQQQMAKGWGKEINAAWDEADHPRGKTTEGSNAGSFAPRGGGEGGGAEKTPGGQAKGGRIEDKTPILPHIVADAVLGDLGIADDDHKLANEFATWADQKFQTDKDFRARVMDERDVQIAGDGAAGRDYLHGVARQYFMNDGVRQRAAEDKAEVGEGYKQLQRSRAYQPPEKIGIGAILRSSWGYDQTNIDYYQVTGMSSSGKTVTLRPIASIDVAQGQKGMGAMSGKKRALPDEFTGKPFQRRIGSNGRIKIRDYASASLWDGRDDYYSWDH